MPINELKLSLTIPYRQWLHGKEACEHGAFLFHKGLSKLDIIGHLIVAKWPDMGLHHLADMRFPSQIADSFTMRNRSFDAPLNFLLAPSHTDTAEAYHLMQLNDDPNMAKEQREESISNFLKTYSIGVRFVETDAEKPKSKIKGVFSNVYLDSLSSHAVGDWASSPPRRRMVRTTPRGTPLGSQEL